MTPSPEVLSLARNYRDRINQEPWRTDVIRSWAIDDLAAFLGGNRAEAARVLRSVMEGADGRI